MNAWLLTWEGTEPETILFDNDNKIVTILSGRMCSKSVELIVYVLYTRCLWTAGDISYFANRKKNEKSITNPSTRITVGVSTTDLIHGSTPGK